MIRRSSPAAKMVSIVNSTRVNRPTRLQAAPGAAESSEAPWPVPSPRSASGIGRLLFAQLSARLRHEPEQPPDLRHSRLYLSLTTHCVSDSSILCQDKHRVRSDAGALAQLALRSGLE